MHQNSAELGSGSGPTTNVEAQALARLAIPAELPACRHAKSISPVLEAQEYNDYCSDGGECLVGRVT